MFCPSLFLVLLSSCLLQISTSKEDVLSRPRRYLVFPEGSTFSIKTLVEGDVDVFTQAAAAAVNYDLPNNTRALGLHEAEATALPHGRHQRSRLYAQAEAVLQELGIEGKECLLRAICEAAQEISPGTGLIPELLRVILLFPEGGYRADEPAHQWRYLAAYRAGLRNQNCRDLFPKCPISLIDMFLGLKPIPHGRF